MWFDTGNILKQDLEICSVSTFSKRPEFRTANDAALAFPPESQPCRGGSNKKNWLPDLNIFILQSSGCPATTEVSIVVFSPPMLPGH